MVVRQRKLQKKPNVANKSPKTVSKTFLSVLSFWLIAGSILIAVVTGWALYEYEKSKLYKPFSSPLAVDGVKTHSRDKEMLWGSYRSQLYFGMKTRTEKSLLFGLLWFAQYPKNSQMQLRYTCEQGDNLAKYGWLYHDGKSFGVQEIVDEDFILTTEFVKIPGGEHGGDWTLRVKGNPRNSQGAKQIVSLLYAVTNEGSEAINYVSEDGQTVELSGQTDILGRYRVTFKTQKGNLQFSSYLSSHVDDIYDVKNAILRKLQFRTYKGDKLIVLPGNIKDDRDHNLFVYQLTFSLPFEVDLLFESNSFDNRELQLTGEHFGNTINAFKRKFDEDFEKKFQLSVKGFSTDEINFAKAALSNMIGGMGYFHGESKVISSSLKEPTNYWKSSLYTAVPSRSFFPRGFLWDEGFHQLLIQAWDPKITYDSIAHWLDMLNCHGWIPREQILGVEARRKVPDEFVVQHSKNANPPTFFLTIESLIAREKSVGELSAQLKQFLKHIYPRLKVWFQWYNTTQIGELAATYRWHGRQENSGHELNAKTLTSGLDDYPRASHPSIDERHVDLRCWMALAAGILANVGEYIGEDSSLYRSTEKHLKNNELLDTLHWSDEFQAYADYGNHTKFVKLERVRISNHPNAPVKLIRVNKSKRGPTLKFVNEFGYVSLFPFLLRILKPSSKKLAIILNDIRNPEKIWTSFGLRSLSKSASLYNKHNTEHDKPYWRGPIWMNINYLAVKGLHYYSQEEGPYKQQALDIYKELRSNLIRNVYNQYKKTGYIWEQYDDSTGKGQGCYPFTGWSALVTLIMSDNY